VTDGREWLVFAGATAVALVHAIDDAFVDRGSGIDLGQHALAGALALAVGVAGILAFPRLRPGLRSGVSLVFGVLALVNGAMHVEHIALGELAVGDATGTLAAAAGAVLLVLGLAIPFRHRGEGAATRRHRWLRRLVAVAAGALVVYVFVFPVSLAVVQTHKFREPIDDPPSEAYEPVSFAASDGLGCPAGTGRRRTGRRSSSSTAAAAIAPAPSRTRSCSPATATASSSTTRAAAARARAARTRSAGAGTRTSPARSPFCASGRTSIRGGSAASASRPAPTC
jgi:hypothetical protein